MKTTKNADGNFVHLIRNNSICKFRNCKSEYKEKERKNVILQARLEARLNRSSNAKIKKTWMFRNEYD